jgi:DNA polymerase-3 subunit delta'
MPFREVVGHQALLRLIARAVARESLPPSLIFAGPDGVGKRLVARALAEVLNCQAPLRHDDGVHTNAFAIDSCGRCPACLRIARGVHSDVVTLEPGETGVIKIEPVREVISAASYRPFEGRRRVVIIDEADQLGRDAQDALLKILEEPPAASVFVLVTSRPDGLASTVRSRCPRLRFGRLTAAEIAGILAGACGFSERDARAAAAAADGSVSRALERRSAEYAAAREAAQALLHAASGTDPRRRLEGARALAGEMGGGRTSSATERDTLGLRLRALSSLLRDVGALSARADERVLANADLQPELLNLVQAYGGTRAVRAFSAVDRAITALVERNASPKIVADWLAFQL